MSPGSMIGAAAMVDSTGKHVDDPKLVAFWKSKMQGAAEKVAGMGRSQLV